MGLMSCAVAIVAATTVVGGPPVRQVCRGVLAGGGARRPGARAHTRAPRRIRSARARSRRPPGSQSPRREAPQKRPADRRPGAVAQAFAAAGCQRPSSTGLSLPTSLRAAVPGSRSSQRAAAPLAGCLASTEALASNDRLAVARPDVAEAPAGLIRSLAGGTAAAAFESEPARRPHWQGKQQGRSGFATPPLATKHDRVVGRQRARRRDDRSSSFTAQIFGAIESSALAAGERLRADRDLGTSRARALARRRRKGKRRPSRSVPLGRRERSSPAPRGRDCRTSSAPRARTSSPRTTASTRSAPTTSARGCSSTAAQDGWAEALCWATTFSVPGP
jgi:hypothetical protein